MNNSFETLTDKEIQNITRLVQTLDQSNFEFLQLELGDVKLTIGKGNIPTSLAAPVANPPAAAPQAMSAIPAAAQAAAVAAPPPAPASQSAPAVPAPAAQPQEGTVSILASTMGRFYARPEPTAEPFVTVGSTVDESSTIGLIEVMKLFNAVSADVSGTIAEICVQDGQIVEHGQVLMRVRPANGHAAGAEART